MASSPRVPACVLVTGANGFVGRGVVDRLTRDGVDVVAAGRGRPDRITEIPQRRWPDFHAVAWDRELAGIDVVIHCAARTHIVGRAAQDSEAEFRRVNVELTLAMARGAASAGVRRFVHVSSAHVNGTRNVAGPFGADAPPRPGNAYARSKWEAEQGLAAIACDTGLEVVTIRPPLVIGRDPKGNLGSLVAAMRRGLPLPLGAVTRNRRDLVSLDTLADLVAHTVDHPAAPGAPLLVSDGRPLSTHGIVSRLAAIHDLEPRLIAVPTSLLGAMLKLVGRESLAAQLLGNLEVDITETCRRLEWHPPRGAIS